MQTASFPTVLVLACLTAWAGCKSPDVDEVFADDGANGSGGAGDGGSSGQGGSGGGTAGGSSGGAGGSGGSGTTGTTSTGTTSTTTGSGGSGTGGSPPACPDAGDPCTKCMAASCESTYCACYENPECFELAGCLAQCLGEECIEDCFSAHAAGASDALVMGHCAATTCDGSCPAGQKLSQCELCAYTSCEAQVTACFAVQDCFDLFQCASACGPFNDPCTEACKAMHPGGAEQAQVLAACIGMSCADSCN